MKHLIYDYDETPYHSRAFDFYFGDMSIGSFDIETTGLSPDRCYVILIGFMELRDSGCRLHQFFAESLSEEEDIIRAFLKEAENTDALLTYNGRTFDVPFMEKRMSFYPTLADEKMWFYDLDMYPVVRNYSTLRSFLPNLKQKTVEDFMGLWDSREDEISGAESVDLYFRYLSDKDPETEEIILCHNRDDVLQLARLMPVLRKADLHKAMFSTGFPMKRPSGCSAAGSEVEGAVSLGARPEAEGPVSPAAGSEVKGAVSLGARPEAEGPVSPAAIAPEGIIVDKISLSAGSLEVSGKQQYNGTDRMIFESSETPYTLSLDSVEMSFHASVPLVVHENMKNLFIADLRPLNIPEEPFAAYPQFSDGLLVLRSENDICYPQAVHFVKEFLNKAIWNLY